MRISLDIAADYIRAVLSPSALRDREPAGEDEPGEITEAQLDSQGNTEKMTRLLSERPIDDTRILVQADLTLAPEEGVKKAAEFLMVWVESVLNPGQQTRVAQLIRRSPDAKRLFRGLIVRRLPLAVRLRNSFVLLENGREGSDEPPRGNALPAPGCILIAHP
jgi:hypothetical protein